MTYIEQIIGKNIKKYVKLNKITLEKLSEKIDINYQNLSKIANGKSFTTAKTFEKLCEALNITPEQLVSINTPEKIGNNSEIKQLLHQIINNLNDKDCKALYKLIQAFLEIVN